MPWRPCRSCPYNLLTLQSGTRLVGPPSSACALWPRAVSALKALEAMPLQPAYPVTGGVSGEIDFARVQLQALTAPEPLSV